MMVMTAKVNMRKVIIGLIAAVAVILALILMLGDRDSSPTAAQSVSGNDARVQFLQDMGWEVTTSPAQSGQVKIPANSSEVFDRYNQLQKSQGYDLTAYAGKQVMRYVYQVNNYPGATDPVYATVLVYQNKVIGGDVTDTSATGVIRSFRYPESSSQPAETQPSTEPTR